MQIINIDKSKTVAFTGHRHINTDVSVLKEKLAEVVHQQYNNGYRAFITGGAMGFDLLAAEVVLELQQVFSDIQLLCATPYCGHHLYFKEEDKQRYINIADKATTNILLSAYYYKDCFLHRNDYMLAHCSLLVAYYNQSIRSGTGYTVRRANRNNTPIINLFK